MVWTSPNYFCVQIFGQKCSDSWTYCHIFLGMIPYLFPIRGENFPLGEIKVGKVGNSWEKPQLFIIKV